MHRRRTNAGGRQQLAAQRRVDDAVHGHGRQRFTALDVRDWYTGDAAGVAEQRADAADDTGHVGVGQDETFDAVTSTPNAPMRVTRGVVRRGHRHGHLAPRCAIT